MRCASFSPDSTRIVTTSADCDLKSGESWGDLGRSGEIPCSIFFKKESSWDLCIFIPLRSGKNGYSSPNLEKLLGDVSGYPEAGLVGLVTYIHLSGHMMTSETIPQIYLNINIK